MTAAAESAPAGPPPAPRLSRWRPSPARAVRLLAGLWLFGTGEALIVDAGLGNSPWTVLAQGVARQTGVAVGTTTIAISFAILLVWLPLRQRPGLGTIANAVIIGLAINTVLALLPAPTGLPVRAAEVALGIACVGLGSGLYLTSFLGPGPRDGLMTGLHRRTGLPIPAVRAALELSAVAGGWALGGTVGVGTLAFALAIGPVVGAVLTAMARGAVAEI